jgi:hypothetical protein
MLMKDFMHIDYNDGISLTTSFSRGYAESIPFNVQQEAFKVRKVMDKQILRQQIEDIILDNCYVGKDGICCDKAVGILVEMIMENCNGY